MNKKLRLSLIAALLLAGGAAYWGFSAKTAEKPAAKGGAPVPVLVAKAEAGEMPVLLNLVGRGEAYEGVTLKSRVDGQVLAVDYREGQAVKAGEPLLRLDPADFQAKLAQAEAVVARDQAQLNKAQADLERYLGLKAKGFVSEEKVNEMRTNASAAAASLKADMAAQELARLQLSYTTIRAPFAGMVGARLVFPGSSVKINDTALVVVNRVNPLYISFSVPERHLPALRQAMQGGAMPVKVSLPGGKGPHWEAKARFIDNAVDAQTGTILLKAVLDNREQKLTPGQFVNVSMVLDTLKEAVLVPNEAVQQGAEGNYLYAVKDDGSVEMRKVQVATSHAGRSAIAQGLVAGETVVTDGQLRLMPGAKVVVKAGKEAPGAPAAANPGKAAEAAKP